MRQAKSVFSILKLDVVMNPPSFQQLCWQSCMDLACLACKDHARILESATPTQGSRFLVRIMVSGDENKALQDMI